MLRVVLIITETGKIKYPLIFLRIVGKFKRLYFFSTAKRVITIKVMERELTKK